LTNTFVEDGKVWSWGRNASHCLGRGVALSGENTPGEVTTLQNCKIVALDAGSDLSVALSATGNVYSWGHNANGQCGQSICNTVPTEIAKLIDVKIVQIACSDWSTHFLDNTGRIWACGYNGEGRLGTGDEADRKVPEQVNTKCILDAGDKIFKIGCGAYHTFALTN
jgi:alpha-tubulin suppressor-like RCC1 family protein